MTASATSPRAAKPRSGNNGALLQGKPPRTWRPIAFWTAGIVLALGLAWFVGAVAVPVWRTRQAVVGAHETFIAYDRMSATVGEADNDYILGEHGVGRLGGPVRAAGQLGRYLRMPGWLAPHKHCALGMLGRCGTEGVGILAEALPSSDITCRRWAARSLEYLGPGAQAAVPALDAALADSDENVRGLAARALGKIGPAANGALPALIALLGRKDIPPSYCSPPLPYPDVGSLHSRVSAVLAMGRIDPEGRVILPSLVGALADSDESIQEQAALIIGSMGSRAREAGPALERLFVGRGSLGPEEPGPSWRVALAAARACWLTTGDRDKPLAYALQASKRYDAALPLMAELGVFDARTLPVFVECLLPPDVGGRLYFRHSQPFKALREALKRQAALLGLGRALEDGDPGVRVSAATVAGLLGPDARQLVPRLETLVREEREVRVRNAAANALGEIRGQEPPK